MRDPKNILVLGVIMGKHLLIKQGGFSVLKVLTNFSLVRALIKFSENLKLGYFYLRNTSSGKILSVETKSNKVQAGGVSEQVQLYLLRPLVLVGGLHLLNC